MDRSSFRLMALLMIGTLATGCGSDSGSSLSTGEKSESLDGRVLSSPLSSGLAQAPDFLAVVDTGPSTIKGQRGLTVYRDGEATAQSSLPWEGAWVATWAWWTGEVIAVSGVVCPSWTETDPPVFEEDDDGALLLEKACGSSDLYLTTWDPEKDSWAQPTKAGKAPLGLSVLGAEGSSLLLSVPDVDKPEGILVRAEASPAAWTVLETPPNDPTLCIDTKQRAFGITTPIAPAPGEDAVLPSAHLLDRGGWQSLEESVDLLGSGSAPQGLGNILGCVDGELVATTGDNELVAFGPDESGMSLLDRMLPPPQDIDGGVSDTYTATMNGRLITRTSDVSGAPSGGDDGTVTRFRIFQKGSWRSVGQVTGPTGYNFATNDSVLVLRTAPDQPLGPVTITVSR